MLAAKAGMDDERETLKENLNRDDNKRQWLNKLASEVEGQEKTQSMRTGSDHLEFDKYRSQRSSNNAENSLVIQELSIVESRGTLMNRQQPDF